MTSNRQLKVGELIRHALSEIFTKGAFFGSTISEMPITVGEVRVTPDLKFATVFVMPLGGKIDKNIFLEELDNNKATIRALLTNKINLKYSPNLIFKFDESFDHVLKIESLLNSKQ